MPLLPLPIILAFIVIVIAFILDWRVALLGLALWGLLALLAITCV